MRADLAVERVGDAASVERLVARAFGPGRFAKTAERVREQARLRLDLSLCGWAAGELVGSVRQWEVRIGPRDAIFLGPIAVEAEQRRHGLGASLIAQACDAARAADEAVVLLVGAAAFFEPLGFRQVQAARVSLPGPVDPERLLWRALRPGAFEGVGGQVGPRL